jgi:hypothetical protein
LYIFYWSCFWGSSGLYMVVYSIDRYCYSKRNKYGMNINTN